jgi:hypothetical protein
MPKLLRSRQCLQRSRFNHQKKQGWTGGLWWIYGTKKGETWGLTWGITSFKKWGVKTGFNGNRPLKSTMGLNE